MGKLIKVRFTRAGESESIWVEYKGVQNGKYVGILRNHPIILNKKYGDTVTFGDRQVLGVGPSKPKLPKLPRKKKNPRKTRSWMDLSLR